jgi:protein-disulfide isomerase
MRTATLSLLHLWLSLALPLASFGQAPPHPNPDGLIAIVAGQPIYEQDLLPELAPKLLQLRSQEYQMKSKALEDLIGQRVIEAEGKKRGLSADKLLEQEVDTKVADPTDAEVEGYYLAIKSQLNQPFPEVKPTLQKAVKALKIQQARQDYADSLRAKIEVVVLLRPPKVEVGYDPARVKGDPKAPVAIVEFSDFQCPYCKKAETTMKDLLTKYNGRVKLAFRDFPLRALHPQAQVAAEAARCAGEQGKFWEYHDALYADQSKLDEPGLVEHARSLGLDEKSFQSCLKAGKFKSQIEQDVQEGSKAGVAGTPGFFINGIFVNGAQPEAEFEKIINAELAAVREGNSTPARADFEAGKRAYEQGDYSAALKELRPLAEQGNAEAQALLGLMYNLGRGVPLDSRQALKWYKAAADQGNPAGQCQLGTLYLAGGAVPKDTAQGLKLLKLAAEQGYPDAYMPLGLAYMNLKDVPRDVVQADMWLRLATVQGEPLARGQLAKLETRMTADQIGKARALAEAWKPKTSTASSENKK